MKRYLLVLLSVLCAFTAWSQERLVSGTVTSAEDGLPIPGVNVIVQGTTKGTATDAEGNYSISLTEAENALVFSFVGFRSATVEIGSRARIDLALEADVTSLDEIVVVGYGTQREKDLTSAITTIRSEEISRTPAGQAMQSLQGKVPGLQIVSSGAPGTGPSVRVRGVGSFPQINAEGKSNNVEGPLYVVDGMFFDNIDFLNPSDIATMSVLKDASAAAIYGVRAANGVILIETKSGLTNEAAQITYDGYYGVQVAQNVLKMANAEQFTNMANESGSAPDASFIVNAMQRYGRSRVNPNVPDVNTDWYDQVLRTAPIQNHTLNVMGGGENTSYSIGGGYFAQDGILDTKNDYERFNLRTKIDFQANDWFKIGANINMTNATRYDAEDAAWNQAYFAVPVLPVYDEMNTGAWPTRYASAQTLGYRSGQNPFPVLEFNDNQNRIRQILANFYVQLDIIPNKLNFRTAYNNSNQSLSIRNVDLPYYVSDGWQRPQATITKTSETFYNQIWDNVLTFHQDIGDHSFEVMAGTSFRDEAWTKLKAAGTEYDIPLDKEQSWYINFANQIPTEQVEDDGTRQYGLSYFGRVTYNFKDKYLIYGTMRADGTSKYQEKWGYFPSVGAGWVISEESFLDDMPAVNFLKLRAGWGRLGNDKVAASDGARTTEVITTAIDGQLVSGALFTNTFDYLGWEIIESWNFGLSSQWLNNRLSVEADYFVRKNINAVIPVRIGNDYVNRNAGEISNRGFELSATWSDQLPNGLSYRVGGNISTLKNEVTDVYGQPYIDGGSAEFRRRTIVGEPLLAFFGYEVAGVYQTDEQVQADPIAVANSLVPGDLMYKDQNHDGLINDNDRVVIGSYIPTLTYGANLGISFKNFDLSASIMGQSGNKILNRKRGEVIWTPDANMDADLAINRWHGEGTSNKYPSSAALRKGWNQKLSTFFVEDGAFFRLQNVQLAYNFRNVEAFGKKMPDSRLILTAERPLTMFSYNGFNPEVPNGLDTQTYPIPAVYTVGLNIKF
ncbi:MAG: TonB-dependent receptor [Bacteroidota bacterium]|nr:TonB-dependent receptor [Bacteroidota bacterium]